MINESGLYNLILRSRKPAAKKFKRWVTHEVLPSIRKTGSYSVPQPKSYLDALSDTLNVLKNQEQRLVALEQREQERQEREQELQEALNEELPETECELEELPLRYRCRKLVEKISFESGKCFRDIWTDAYKELNYRCRTNLKRLAKERRVRILDVIEDRGWMEMLYAILQNRTRAV